MKKLILILIVLLTGCSTFSENNIQTIEGVRYSGFLGPLAEGPRVVEVDGVMYINVEEYAELLNGNPLGTNIIYKEFDIESTENAVTISINNNPFFIEFSANGKVKVQYYDYYESSFQGLMIAPENWVHTEVDEFNFRVNSKKLFMNERLQMTFIKEIDITDFGLSVIESDGIFYPLHLVDFFMSGLNSHFVSVEDNHLVYTRDRQDKIDKVKLTKSMKNYMIGFYEFMVSNFTVSRNLHTDELKDSLALREDIIKLRGSKFYLEFQKMIYDGGERHNWLTIRSKYYLDTIDDLRSYAIGDIVFDDEFTITEEENYTYINYTSMSNIDTVQLREYLLNTSTENLVLDLRGNRGGVSTHMYIALATIMEEYSSYYSDRFGFLYEEVITSTDDVFDGNIYLLISDTTYSSANILTQIVKDQERAIIIGEKTGGGDASISYVYAPDGSVLYLEIAPGMAVGEGNVIIDTGVEPDIFIDAELALIKAIELIG